MRYYNLDRGAKLAPNSPTGAFRIRSGGSPMYDPAAGEGDGIHRPAHNFRTGVLAA